MTTHITRRNALSLTAAAAIVPVTGLSAHASAAIEITNNGQKKMLELTSGRNDVTFRSQGVNLVGHLYLPEDFDNTKKYPTVVFSGPLGQVKEQMAANYGDAMVARGYVYLAFDHIGFGDSEGDLRQDENPFKKMEGIRDAVSYLGTLPFVDRDRLFGIAGCASASYMPVVAVTDKRIKALATVSGLLDGHSRFFGGGMPKEVLLTLIKASNAARQSLYEQGTLDPVDLIGFEKNDPATLDPNSINGQGYDYYQTARAGSQTFPNYDYRVQATMFETQPLVSARQWAPYLNTPFLGIYGSAAMDNTAQATLDFFAEATEPKELYEVKDARHVDLYDYPHFVAEVADKIDSFFQKHSG
ncbi:alpha/beta hydrolase [Roseibium sp. MMSF_3544]|uniref:alpha/beta hydrolase n=1 Tax=unclassified Roseibium TaxID=2629323 RepID=UPI00273D0F67|nr:alpha/beta hydrolase [Roseibium sp. MMSF_3544]